MTAVLRGPPILFRIEPARDRLAALHLGENVETRVEPVGRAQEVVVVAQQEIDARVKTGSLSGVAAVAGYVDGESGRRHVVVGLIQHPDAAQARPVLDALLSWVRQDQ